MNSTERHELRYQRRRARREENRRKRNEEIGTLDSIFAYHRVFRAGRKCCNGVRWKQSIQNFELHLFSRTARACRSVKNGTWHGTGYSHFILCERGKLRPIDAPHITDRQVHKIVTQDILYPLYRPSMIKENGASQPNMGLSFHFSLLKENLHQHYRIYGRSGYVVLIDLKSFFPGAPHWAVYQRHDRLIYDGRIRNLCDQVIQDFEKYKRSEVGMPLGVEPSQIEMVALPSATDTYARCQLGVDSLAHYMDDYHALFPTLEEAENFLAKVEHLFQNQGLQINKNKCRIVPLTKKFKFCKATFWLTDTGKVICRRDRKSFSRARHKIRSFVRMVKEGLMSLDEIKNWYKVQSSQFKNSNDHNRVLRLNRFIYNLFKFELGGAQLCLS